MDGHQIDRIESIDRRVGLVADGEAVEMCRQSCQRRIATVLHTPQQRTDLLEVLPSLEKPRTAQFVRVCGLGQDEIHQFRGRHPINELQPSPVAARASTSARMSELASCAIGDGGMAARRALDKPGESKRSASSEIPNSRDRITAAARRSDTGSARYQTSASTSLISSASKNPRPL